MVLEKGLQCTIAGIECGKVARAFEELLAQEPNLGEAACGHGDRAGACEASG